MTAPPLEPKKSVLSAWLRDVDDVLRGRFSRPAELGEGGTAVPVRGLIQIGVVLGIIYGLSLGTYAVIHGGEGAWLQVFSSAVKLPLLFLLTFVVTFPSLYVFAALLRLPLGRLATLRLLLVAIVVNLAVLASLGPVFAFFAASTRSYDFLLLLNVVFATVGGVISLALLQRATIALLAGQPPDAPTARPPDGPTVTDGSTATDGPDRRRAGRIGAGRRLLVVWCLVYGTVGAQMSWLLRPFLGAPGQPFELVRGTESSFFEAVWQSWLRFVSGS